MAEKKDPKGFEDWKGNYALRFPFPVEPCPLVVGSRSRRFAREISGYTDRRIRDLNVPRDADNWALWLKNQELMVPDHPEIWTLDVENAEAVEAFIRKYDFRYWTREQGLELFAYRTLTDQFYKHKLIKNIVFQVWRWIKKGILPPLNNIVRNGWYRYIKPVLAAWKALDAPDYDLYFLVLRELTRTPELDIQYRDFGFIDHDRGTYWNPGTARPEIFFFSEKDAVKGVFDRLNEPLGASYLINHGQPNRFRIESLGLEIAEALEERGLESVQMISVVDFNPGGFSIEAAGVEGLKYYGVETEVHRVIELKAIPPEDLEVFKATLTEAIVGPDGRVLEMIQGKEAGFAQCRNWWNEVVRDERFRDVEEVTGGTRVTYYGFDMETLGLEFVEYRMGRFLRWIDAERKARGRGRRKTIVNARQWVDQFRADHGLAGRLRRAPPVKGLGELAHRYEIPGSRYEFSENG